jgi:hypothetical protein
VSHSFANSSDIVCALAFTIPLQKVVRRCARIFAVPFAAVNPQK